MLGAEVGVGVKPARGVAVLASGEGEAGFDGAAECPTDAQPARAADVVSKNASCACAKRVMETHLLLVNGQGVRRGPGS